MPVPQIFKKLKNSPMPLYTLVEVHYWLSKKKKYTTEKRAMLINKMFSATNFTTFEMLFIFILVYHWHYFIVYIYKLSTQWLWKVKKNGDSRLIFKGNLRASTNLSLPSLHYFKFWIFVIIQNLNYLEELKKKIEFYLVF